MVLFFTYGNFFLGFVKLLVVGYSGGVLTMHLHNHCFTITQAWIFLLFAELWDHPASYSMHTKSSFPGINMVGVWN